MGRAVEEVMGTAAVGWAEEVRAEEGAMGLAAAGSEVVG